MLIVRKKELVSIQVIYYMPKHKLLLNEFMWQTEDIIPELKRVHSFLNYWKDNIEATIESVNVAVGNKGSYRKADFFERLH